MLGPNIVMRAIERKTEAGLLLITNPEVDRDNRRLMVFQVLYAPPQSEQFPEERAYWTDAVGNRFAVPKPGEYVLCYTTMTTPFVGGYEAGDDSGLCVTQVQSLLAIVDSPTVDLPSVHALDEKDTQVAVRLD